MPSRHVSFLRCSISLEVDSSRSGVEYIRLQASTAAGTVEWSIAATAAPPVSVQIVHGDNQAAFVNQQVMGLRIFVLDQYGNRREDDFVTWTVTSGGGSVSAGARARDEAIWTLGPTPGTQTLTVSVNAAPTISATFTATAFAGP
jgi:hypothetical protein